MSGLKKSGIFCIISGTANAILAGHNLASGDILFAIIGIVISLACNYIGISNIKLDKKQKETAYGK